MLYVGIGYFHGLFDKFVLRYGNGIPHNYLDNNHYGLFITCYVVNLHLYGLCLDLLNVVLCCKTRIVGNFLVCFK